MNNSHSSARRLPLYSLPFAFLLLLPACGSQPAASDAAVTPSTIEAVTPSMTESVAPPSPSPSVAPPDASDGEVVATRFETVDELRAALESTGVECTGWNRDDLVANARESGCCSLSGWGLSAYEADVDARAVVELSGTSAEPQPFLVGSNWLITRGYDDSGPLTAVRDDLGGVIWNPGDPYPS